jgi:DNA-binding response OmpR family regulator
MAPTIQFAGAEEGDGPERRPLRVLIVDDEHDTVLTLMAMLRDEGFDTKGVYDGADAVHAVATYDPDIVVMDIAMPRLSGWDAARAIRAASRSEQRPILIALSGVYKQGADKVLARMSGFDYFLTKPCDPAVLLKLLAFSRTE